MALSSPSKKLFFFSLLLVAIGVVSRYHHIQYVTPNALWMVVAGYAVLATGNLFRNV